MLGLTSSARLHRVTGHQGAFNTHNCERRAAVLHTRSAHLRTLRLTCCAWNAASGKKKTLNVGRSGGSAGLDDFSYDTALDTDDIEFM